MCIRLFWNGLLAGRIKSRIFPFHMNLPARDCRHFTSQLRVAGGLGGEFQMLRAGIVRECLTGRRFAWLGIR